MSIIGLKESSNKHFLPHYYTMQKLYDNSRIVHVESKSVMYVRDALGALDFWNLDSDLFFTEDMIGFQNLLNYGGNHFAYFNGFLKVYRIAHGLFENDSFLKNDWNKNKAHNLDIYSNFLTSDIILISPVLADIFSRTLPDFFSKAMLKQLKPKFLILPPPDLYKLKVEPQKKDFSKLVFLWNHRFTEGKNYKAFFNIIKQLKDEHPKVPIELLILSLNTEDEVKKFVPEGLHKYINYHPFIYDKKEYQKVVNRANITIGTSKIESFGISVFDAVSQGLALINLECNEAFTLLVGPETTFKEKEAAEAIYKIYSDKAYRKKVLDYNLKGLQKLPNKPKFIKTFSDRVNTVYENMIDRTAGKSPKIQAVLKKLDKKALTKREVYEVMGWKSTGSCMNAFWSEYYYGLRKHGVQTTFQDGILYYHLGDELKIKPKKESKTKGLFN